MKKATRIPGLAIAITSLSFVPATAQIIPDTTLPQNSVATPSNNRFQIDGGTTAGTNLFHSFREFSLPAGTEAFFNNSASDNIIITRVTGSSISQIDGLIRSQGTANLFLINPNGIVFGPNARLDIGGSFLGSTASSILFDNGVEFRATNTNNSPNLPLLSVNIPVGLQLGDAPGAITTRGQLHVTRGQSIALVGGAIALMGGELAIPAATTDGRIDLLAGASSTASLMDTGWQLDRQTVGQAITLDNGAIVRVTDPGMGGGVRLQGGAIALDNEARVIAETTLANLPHADLTGGQIEVLGESLTFNNGARLFSLVADGAAGNGANANVQLAGALTGRGIAASNPIQPSGIRTNTRGGGTGGAIAVRAGSLELIDGSTIEARTQSASAGGTVQIDVNDTIRLVGINPVMTGLSSGLQSIALGSGPGGAVSVRADRIEVTDGADITSTLAIEIDDAPVPNAGTGSAGDVEAIASRQILVKGPSPLEPANPSGIGSANLGIGSGGTVRVSAPQIRIESGGQISSGAAPSISSLSEPLLDAGTGDTGDVIVTASEFVEVVGADPIAFNSSFIGPFSLAAGNAGNLSVTTPQLSILDGGQVNSTTSATGNAGSVTINADVVRVSGTEATGEPSELSSSAFKISPILQQLFFAPPTPTGSIGNLTVNADRLIVTNSGLVTVEHDGIGDAGNLQLNVNEISVDRGGTIDANTMSGNGGNIAISGAQTLQLRRRSQLNLEAGGTGNGGNLRLDAATIVLLEASTITANAFTGDGGNIQIETQGLYQGGDSAITASSQFGIDGVVQITTPEVDSVVGLVELEQNPLSPSDRIVTGCASALDNSLRVSGRGGLPPNPEGLVIGDRSWVDLRDLPLQSSTHPRPLPGGEEKMSLPPQGNVPQKLVEANGWIVRSDGQIELVALASRSQKQPLPLNCPIR